MQSLSSGVLRGEEYNSISEQSARLQQALAAGIGVTTGELRKLAEAGAR
jgi:tape measure domain-containing protein